MQKLKKKMMPEIEMKALFRTGSIGGGKIFSSD
jgi:hypothetical protein